MGYTKFLHNPALSLLRNAFPGALITTALVLTLAACGRGENPSLTQVPLPPQAPVAATVTALATPLQPTPTPARRPTSTPFREETPVPEPIEGNVEYSIVPPNRLIPIKEIQSILETSPSGNISIASPSLIRVEEATAPDGIVTSSIHIDQNGMRTGSAGRFFIGLINTSQGNPIQLSMNLDSAGCKTELSLVQKGPDSVKEAKVYFTNPAEGYAPINGFEGGLFYIGKICNPDENLRIDVIRLP